MIIVAVIGLAILLFVSMVSISKPLWRAITSLIIAALLGVSLLFVVLNDSNHFGMKKVII